MTCPKMESTQIISEVHLLKDAVLELLNPIEDNKKSGILNLGKFEFSLAYWAFIIIFNTI